MAGTGRKQGENTVGKGEIACDEQFLLFPLALQTLKNQGLFGKGLTLFQTSPFVNGL